MITGTFNSAVGTIKVEIQDGGASERVEIVSIGELKYEFDLTPDNVKIESLRSIYNKIKIEIFQHTATQVDIYDRLRTATLSEGNVPVSVFIDSDEFQFFVSLNDISLKETERTITLDARVLYDEDVTTLEVFDKIEAEEPAILHSFRPDPDNVTVEDDIVVDAEELDAVGVMDWIEYALKLIFKNELPATLHSVPNRLGHNYTDENYESYRSGIPTGRVGFLMARMTSPPFDGFSTQTEDQQGLILYSGNFIFEGSGFEDALNNGDSITLYNTAGEELSSFIVSEVVSDSRLEITKQSAPPSFGWYLWKSNKKMRTSHITALENMLELAGIEGSIFGTGFGRNFYINRVQNQSIVTIDWDDVIEYDSKPFYNPFGAGRVEQLARTLVDANPDELNKGSENFGIWPVSEGKWEVPVITEGTALLKPRKNIEQELNMRLAPGYPFLSKAKGEAASGLLVGRYTDPFDWNVDYNPTLALCRTGLNSYKASLSNEGDGQVNEFKIFDALSIKPWNLFQFENAPDKYMDRLFRPTSLGYDLVLDTLSCKAYELQEADIPVPGTGIVVAGQSSSDGTVQFSVLRNVLITPDGRLLKTDDGRYLTAIPANSISVEGSSSSDGVVVVKVAGSKFIDASGSSSSDGTVSTQAQKQLDVSGESASDGSVLIDVLGVTRLGVNGGSSSDGTVTTKRLQTKEINVRGSSSSDGEVITTVDRENLEPKNVTAGLIGDTPNIQWDEPDAGQPSGYSIAYNVNNTGWVLLDDSISGSTTTYQHTGACDVANNGDDIQYRVRAGYPGQTSAWTLSNTIQLANCTG